MAENKDDADYGSGRKHPAHPAPIERLNKATILLVTVAVWKRREILACEEAQAALLAAWRKADHWRVGYYMIMPDHVHLFCSPAKWERASVKNWCSYWKRSVGEICPALKGQFEWDCWDTQMRTGDHYARKFSYVRRNPVRAELVQRPEDWPFQGKMNVLTW